MPLVIQPKFFPVDSGPAAALIAGAKPEARMALAGDLLSALWKDDRNIADPALLDELGRRHGAKPDKAQFEVFTREAIARNVFGAPSFVYRDEIFWGQDRLDFLDRALAK